MPISRTSGTVEDQKFCNNTRTYLATDDYQPYVVTRRNLATEDYELCDHQFGVKAATEDCEIWFHIADIRYKRLRDMYPYHGQAWPQNATVCVHMTDKSGYRRLRAMFPYTDRPGYKRLRAMCQYHGQAWLQKTMNYVFKLRTNLVTKDFELCFHITDRPCYRRL